jgi:hypothetical protein
VIGRRTPYGRGPLRRRAFLRGAFGVSVGLPFLESLPERSAWAAGEEPVFSLFIGATCGLVPERFFPDATGAFTEADLAAAGKATSELSAHADDLLFVSGIDWAFPNMGDAHASGYSQMLTATPPSGANYDARATGQSADVFIASKVHPDLEPLTLYAGHKKNGFMAERLSFREDGTIRAAVDNPYTLYLELMGIVGQGGMTPEGEEATRRLLTGRNSIHDLVREELAALRQHSRLSATDRQKLDQHTQSIRDYEVMVSGMGDDVLEQCAADGLEVTKIEALQNYAFDKYVTTEETARLHLSLVALAFACNYRRVATLQWGDPYDQTVYNVPSNDRGWKFSWVCHRTPSDSGVGEPDALAGEAHAEIDAVRMRTLSAGLDHFKARGLEDRCFVLWTNCFRDGPAHNFHDIPHIIWGRGGGYLRQGGYVDVGGQPNSRMLNTLISAATQDTGVVTEDFGEGPGGLLDPIIL